MSRQFISLIAGEFICLIICLVAFAVFVPYQHMAERERLRKQ